MNFNDIQFDNEPAPEKPEPVKPLKDILGMVLEAAKSLAKANKLDCGDGKLLCWGCKGPGATYPSLNCKTCLKAFQERAPQTATYIRSGHPYRFSKLSEASHRFEALARNLRDKTYDYATCTRILSNASDHPNSNELRAIYSLRFKAELEAEKKKIQRPGGDSSGYQDE